MEIYGYHLSLTKHKWTHCINNSRSNLCADYYSELKWIRILLSYRHHEDDVRKPKSLFYTDICGSNHTQLFFLFLAQFLPANFYLSHQNNDNKLSNKANTEIKISTTRKGLQCCATKKQERKVHSYGRSSINTWEDTYTHLSLYLIEVGGMWYRIVVKHVILVSLRG